MRILVDIRHLVHEERSGVGGYTVQVLRALFRQDAANEYVLISTGTRKPHVRALFPDVLRPGGNVSSVHVPIPNKALSASVLTARRPFLDRLAGGHFDIAFLPNLSIISLSPGLPYALTAHDLSWKWFPTLYSRKMRAWHKAVRPDTLIPGAERIIVPSAATKRDVERAFAVSDERVRVIPHGIDPVFTAHPQASDHGVRSRYKLPRRYGLSLGTLEPRKNLLTLIDGMQQYRRETRDDLPLVLAGGWGWSEGELRRRLLHPDVRPWVRHLDYVRSEDRPALYRSAQIFVWPSLYEGFGLPVLEAMACGTPVITSATSSLPEVTSGAAILIHPYHSRDIASALRELLGSTKLRARLREAGIRRAADFSWETAASHTYEIFSGMVKRRESGIIDKPMDS